MGFARGGGDVSPGNGKRAICEPRGIEKLGRFLSLIASSSERRKRAICEPRGRLRQLMLREGAT
jgi:hypothetical protein